VTPASPRHRPPASCPVCGDRLLLTRLGCEGCGSELAGAFEPCRFCALDRPDRELLEVFLRSRGNLKELARHLDVSYPTARSRYDALLERLGLEPTDAEELATLRSLARGDIDVDEAERRL
jgi:hypothetical protein